MIPCATTIYIIIRQAISTLQEICIEAGSNDIIGRIHVLSNPLILESLLRTRNSSIKESYETNRILRTGL